MASSNISNCAIIFAKDKRSRFFVIDDECFNDVGTRLSKVAREHRTSTKSRFSLTSLRPSYKAFLIPTGAPGN